MRKHSKSAGKAQNGMGVNGAGGKKGGTITVLTNSDVDYIDPGLAYYQFTYEVVYPSTGRSTATSPAKQPRFPISPRACRRIRGR